MKRSAFEIAITVLEIMERHSVPTKIMFSADINWNTFTATISGLKTIGLVKETVLGTAKRLRGRGVSYSDTETASGRRNAHTLRRYSLTEKGREVLSLVKILNEKMGGLGIERNTMEYALPLKASFLIRPD